MDVFEAIKKRYSSRAYKNEPVDEEILQKVLEAGRLAPSAHNAQDWKFIVVKNQQKKEAIAKACLGQSFIAQAPVVIVGVSLDPQHLMANEVSSGVVNLSIALDHMILEATELGLGTCWIGAFSQKEIKKILEIPQRYKVIALFPLGWPADRPKEKSRKPLKEIVSYDRF